MFEEGLSLMVQELVERLWNLIESRMNVWRRPC